MIAKSVMHVSFFVKDMDSMVNFYENVLGCKPKMLVRNKAYKDKPGHVFYQRAQENPDGICIVYYELAPGQFVEFFLAFDEQKPHTGFNEHVGYSHFGLLVDDIHATRDYLVSKGVEIDVEPTIGNSHTWQMWVHDPEGNRFEFMQYTENSYQIVGHIDPQG